MMVPEGHVGEEAGEENEMLQDGDHGQSISYQEMEDIDILDSDENELQRLLEDELEDGSGEEQNPRVVVAKKKRYHRHTQRQIYEMEAFFKECPHPDDKQRKELSRVIGLEPLQIKFWFQNKRTQIKAQNERHENSHLRAVNLRLSSENAMMKEVLSHGLCTNCGGSMELGQLAFEGNDLLVENAKLREEIERISSIAVKHAEKQPMSSQKPVIIELAVAAMDELVAMAQLCEPLWMSRFDRPLETLNEGIYIQNFPRGLGVKLAGLKTEATRETAVVPLNAVNIIEMLMDANQWTDFFPSIVSRGVTLDVLSNGAAETFNGALQVMSALFQMATPLVPSREGLFIRYCKQHAEKTWAVVDVSFDGSTPNPSLTWRRRPSGCLIQEMTEGFSKVTWVEHMEVDDTNVAEIYKPLVNSGLAFGAQRWVLALKRQCYCMASVNNDELVDQTGALTSAVMRKRWMKLSERMVRIFANGVSSAASGEWSLVAGTGVDYDVRATTRKSRNEPGSPPGIILNATTSVWLQAPARRVFDFLHSENSRGQWDILTNNGVIEEVSQVANGGSHGNCVSLLCVKNESLQSSMMILQESSIDASGAYVIYAPLDDTAMGLVLKDGEPDFVALLPSGFAVFPDGPAGLLNGGNVQAGSLLTVSFQILLNAAPSERIPLSSISTINSLIAVTVDRIKSAVSCEEVP